MNSVNSLASLRSRLERIKGRDSSTCSNNTQEVTCRSEDFTDNRTWLDKIEIQGNRAEDWLEYTRYISQKTKFPNRVQQHNYLCEIYEKALTAIPARLNKNNEAYAQIFVEYATIKSYVLPEEAIQLMSQACAIVRRFAIVHIMAAELEYKQGYNVEGARRILEKASQLHAEPKEKLKEAMRRLETRCNSLMPEQRFCDKKEEVYPVLHKSPVSEVKPEPRDSKALFERQLKVLFMDLPILMLGEAGVPGENHQPTASNWQLPHTMPKNPPLTNVSSRDSKLGENQSSNMKSQPIPNTRHMRNLPMRVKRMNLKFREMAVNSDGEEENKENEESFSHDIKPLDFHTTYHTFASSGYNSMLDVTIPMETKEIHSLKEEEVPKRLDASMTTTDTYSVTNNGHTDSLMRHSSDRLETSHQVIESKPLPRSDLPLQTYNPVSTFHNTTRPNIAKSESQGILQTTAERHMMLKSVSESGLHGLQSRHCFNNHSNLQQNVPTHIHGVVNPSVAHHTMPLKPCVAPTVPERMPSPPVSTKLEPPAQLDLVACSISHPKLSLVQHSTGQQSTVPVVMMTPSQPETVIQSPISQQHVTPLQSVITKQDLAPPLPVLPPKGKVPVSNFQPPAVQPNILEPTPVKQATRNTQDIVMSTPSMKGIPPPPIPSTPSVQMEDITIHGQTYWVLQLVGRGGSSQVYKVINSSLEIQAIKVVNLVDANEQILEGYRNEIQLLQRLQYCPKVIRMFDYEYIEERSRLYIVMEHGTVDFAMYIKTRLREDGQLSDNTIKFYWEDMLQAVRALHKEGIIHSDLKPSNFLVIDGKLKLIDFGIAKAIQQDKTSVVVDTQVGTLNYMSPETIMESCGGESFDENGKKRPVYKIGVKSDVWSLGCILYYMVYGHTPFQKITKTFIKFQAICNPNFPIQFKEIPDRNLLDVLKKCLTRDPKLRPGIDELLAHPYVTNKDTKMETDCDNIHLERLVRQLAEKFSSSPGGIRSLVHSAIKKDSGC